MNKKDIIKQTYKALSVAAERIGINNYRQQKAEWDKKHRSKNGFKFCVTQEHKDIIELMPKVLSGEVEPEQAMAALWQYDTLKQRGCMSITSR